MSDADVCVCLSAVARVHPQENESNFESLYPEAGMSNACPYTKDAFHRKVVNGAEDAVNPDRTGTKACFHASKSVGPGETWEVQLRFTCDDDAAAAAKDAPFDGFDDMFASRIKEADEFYAVVQPELSEDLALVQRQAFGGLLWSKQWYHFGVYVVTVGRQRVALADGCCCCVCLLCVHVCVCVSQRHVAAR